MSRVWVVNASPLILLGKIGHVALLGKLADELVVSAAVAREVANKPAGERALAEVATFPGARFEPEIAMSAELLTWNLGQGESQVLALAGANSGSRAILDDLDARRCAQSFGVPLIGTIGVVLRAKRRGVIAMARPVIEELRRVGLYASDSLIERALAHLGE